jgi:hypothetical protein
MATPPPQSKARSVYSEEEKRGLLDNFDLEGESATAHVSYKFREALSFAFADPRVTF